MQHTEKYRITNKIRFTTANWVKTLKGCITLKEPFRSYGWKERLKVGTVAKSESDLLHHFCNCLQTTDCNMKKKCSKLVKRRYK